jgi:hypothetical protein
MIDRNRPSARAAKRRAVLDEQPDGMEQQTAPYRRKRGKRKSARLIPLLFVMVLGALIAHNEIPAFAEWLEKLVAPQDWQAKQLCQQAALEAAADPAFARVIKPGEVHSTSEGLYVDKLVLGEMGEGGAEQSVEYSCYLDGAGKLVRVNRL